MFLGEKREPLSRQWHFRGKMGNSWRKCTSGDPREETEEYEVEEPGFTDRLRSHKVSAKPWCNLCLDTCWWLDYKNSPSTTQCKFLRVGKRSSAELLLCGTVTHWHLELVELPATRSFNGKREMNEKGEHYALSKVNLLAFLISLSFVYQYLREPDGCNWSWAWSVKGFMHRSLCSWHVLYSLC